MLYLLTINALHNYAKLMFTDIAIATVTKLKSLHDSPLILAVDLAVVYDNQSTSHLIVSNF